MKPVETALFAGCAASGSLAGYSDKGGSGRPVGGIGDNRTHLEWNFCDPFRSLVCGSGGSGIDAAFSEPYDRSNPEMEMDLYFWQLEQLQAERRHGR